MKKALDNFNDVFSFLTDSLVDTDDFVVENIIDSLYDYGSLHGEFMQTKVETLPFYNKQFKKVTVKQQKQMRAVNSVQDESEYSDEDDEVDVVPVKTAGKKGKGKNVGASTQKNSSHTTASSSIGKTFLGVSVAAKSSKQELTPASQKFKLGGQTPGKPEGSGNFEATIFVGQRKVMLGTFATVELAAQAHDRALIRANGPHNSVQPGVLNFPIHTYARDSLSKFSAFDTILRKQLFGSDWTGPKPCDFGFLMTQQSEGLLKRTGPFNAMDGSQRKKRFKGQYGEGDCSNSDDEFGSPHSNKGKRLLYGNYYVMEPVRTAKRTPAEHEEPYFKSTNQKGQPRFKKETAQIGGYNKKHHPASSGAAVEDSAIPQAGDTIVVMHGQKERNMGRTPYERGIILDKMAFGGWMVVGFADQSSKHLRGELVTVIGPCEAHMKFMKVPAEAVTEEDKALLIFFERNNMVKRKFRPSLPLATEVVPVVPSATATSSSTSSASAVAAASAGGGTGGVSSSSYVQTALEDSGGNTFARAAVMTDHSSRSAAGASALVVHKRHNPTITDVHKKLASAWYAHYKLDASEMDEAAQQDYDPESLYTMANYPYLNGTRVTVERGLHHSSSNLSCSSNSNGASGTNSADSSQQSDVWGSGGQGKRGSRTGLVTTSAGLSNRPANFQAFNSNMFSPKMTDISASACYILSQELTLFTRLLERARSTASSLEESAAGEPQRSRGNSLEVSSDRDRGRDSRTEIIQPEVTPSSIFSNIKSLFDSLSTGPITTAAVTAATTAATASATASASANAGYSSSTSTTLSIGPNAPPVVIPPVPSVPCPQLHPSPLLCWQRSILYPTSREMLDLLTTTRVQLSELLCSRNLDLLSLARRAAGVGVRGFEGISEVLFDAQICNSASGGSAASSSATSGATTAATTTAEGVNEEEESGNRFVCKYTFELPADNRKLILDLGVSAALVNASVIISSSTFTAAGEPAAGVIIVGYFNTAFEAALVREQILGLTRTNFGMSTSYGGTAGERNMVSSRPNFTSAEWTELRKMGKLVARFTRKSCMP